MRIHWLRWCLGGCFLVLSLINIGIFTSSSYLNSPTYIKSNIPGTPIDETPPNLKLNGAEEITVAIGTSFHDPGIKAFDDRGETTISTEGEVDTNVAGDYVLKYVATDEHNNSASLERKVKVIKPTGIIYLTFDDGPGDHTDRLLDVLAKHGVHATFFVTGRGEDGLIRREHDEGHTVALHTFSHNYSYVYSSVENYFADLYRIQDRVKQITGEVATLIRFPGGSSNTVSARYDGGSHIMSTLVREVSSRGFTYFDWNIASGDAGNATSDQEVYERVINNLKPGESSVVLQHDTKSFSIDAVEKIIIHGKENGYIFDKLTSDSFTAHHGVNN